MPAPVVTEDFIEFNLGTPENPALVKFIFRDALYEMAKVTIDDRAQSLIKIKMVILGYVYNDWGPDAEVTKQNWRSWLAESGLYSDVIVEDVTQACEQSIQNTVADLSEKWARLGLWTNLRDERGEFKFCSICYRVMNLSSECKDNPRFASFIVEEAEDGLRSQTFSDYKGPGQLWCMNHMPEVVNDVIERGIWGKKDVEEFPKLLQDT